MALHTLITVYFALFVASLFALITPLTKTQLWTFDLLNLTTTTTNPNIMDVDLQMIRLGRGRVGGHGFFDIKKDIYNLTTRLTVQRSMHKDGPYSVMPFMIDNVTLTPAMNRFYKTLLMPSADRCCQNAPSFKDKFVPPLKKAYITVNPCELSIEQLPAIMMEGYYIVHITFFIEHDRVDIVQLTYVVTKGIAG